MPNVHTSNSRFSVINVRFFRRLLDLSAINRLCGHRKPSQKIGETPRQPLGSYFSGANLSLGSQKRKLRFGSPLGSSMLSLNQQDFPSEFLVQSAQLDQTRVDKPFFPLGLDSMGGMVIHCIGSLGRTISNQQPLGIGCRWSLNLQVAVQGSRNDLRRALNSRRCSIVSLHSEHFFGDSNENGLATTVNVFEMMDGEQYGLVTCCPNDKTNDIQKRPMQYTRTVLIVGLYLCAQQVVSIAIAGKSNAARKTKFTLFQGTHSTRAPCLKKT